MNHFHLRCDEATESRPPRKLSAIMDEMDWLQNHLPKTEKSFEPAAGPTAGPNAGPTAAPVTATASESVGAYLRQQFGLDSRDTLPLPSDFKTLAPEKQKKIFPLTANPNTSNPAERAVQYYLQAIGISLTTAVELGLSYAQLPVVRDSPKRDADGQPLKEKVLLPFLAYPFQVNGRILSYKARSCNALPPVYADEPVRFSKYFMQLTDHSPLGISPFHIDCIAPERLQGKRVPQLLLTEGEKDCVALCEAGFPYCISVPNGADSNPEEYLKPFLGWLEAVDSVVLCGDTDLPGRTMVNRLAQLLGSHARFVEYPADCKDIGEVLLRYGKETVRHILENAHPPQLDQIVTVAQLHDTILDYLDGNYDHGYDVGYGPYTDHVFHPSHEGGLIVVTGQPNCGKSSFLKDLMLHMMVKEDIRFLLFSFEDADKAKHYAQMARLYLKTNNPKHVPRAVCEDCLRFLNNHMAHVDLRGELATPDSIYQLADSYLHQRPFDYLIIDPYVYVDFKDRPKDENETQNVKYLLTKLQSWGHRNHVWVVIVAHPRKSVTAHGGHTSDDVSPDDIAASAHWKNLADFLFALKRVNEPGRRYTELNMLKVRDQDLCSTGKVYYVRQPWGTFLEMPDPESCEQWYQAHEQTLT